MSIIDKIREVFFVNITHLQYFVTLAKLKNFTQAADSLFITQPSLSQSISRLEKELNTTLFKRSTVKVELTYTGELLLNTAQDILYLYEDVTKQISMVQDVTLGTLSIGLPYAYANLVLPPVLQTFTRRYPKVKISVTEGRSAYLMEQFSANKLDLVMLDSDALSALSNQKHYQCDQIIKEDPLVFILPPNHSLCRSGVPLPQTKYNLPTLSLEELAGSHFVMLHPHHRIRRKLNKFFEEEKFCPDVVLEVNQLESALYNAVYAKAVTVVPYAIFARFTGSNKGYAFLCRNGRFLSNLYCVYSTNSPCCGTAREFSRTGQTILQST